jgi:hypothetical protein
MHPVTLHTGFTKSLFTFKMSYSFMDKELYADLLLQISNELNNKCRKRREKFIFAPEESIYTCYLLKVHLQTFLSIPITQKCQIFSCCTLVANEIYMHVPRLILPPSPLAFGTNMRTCKSTSHGTMHVKNWSKTIATKEKPDISRLKKR